ncbi:hypothetical protein CVS30_01425 [Arthrobacter psychrolactophilus]|uniref:Imidazole glycerol phosphate synthase subunit HisH n=1 Tax=Arthrobacter psychrolactophilus TaxID=92442 RepID=A0A2V5JP03_9MICC|nr:hypothetical protein [Arthrobacter psychrolactophilus]PYI40206.1 hypothetical protein CVS30_01425 [Arthrobacter psychrolactophilus]
MSLFRIGGIPGMIESRDGSWPQAITHVDSYALDDPATRELILGARGLIISGGADHLLLAKYRDELSNFVRNGSRVLISGHVSIPFIEGLARWSKLEFRNPSDVRPQPLASHPIWHGVDYQELEYRTGVPGAHSYQELERIGVAGFYGRGYHVNLPEGASVITGIGALALPLDYAYRLGAGEVVVHGGLDLEGVCDEHYSSKNLGPNLVSWLSAATLLEGALA